MATDIQWTDETWNPVTGCTKVSPGCKNCYAEGVANRFWAAQYDAVPIPTAQQPVVDSILGPIRIAMRPRQFTDVQTHTDRLDQPLHWKKPRRIFVNSMSDLFHEDVPDEFIDRVFSVMFLRPQHTFQVLTKRADRMRDYILSRTPADEGHVAIWTEVGPEGSDGYLVGNKYRVPWPLPNVWLGVSVENQHFADARIPLLLQTPAAVRFISAEPLLGPLNIFARNDGGQAVGASVGTNPHIDEAEQSTANEMSRATGGVLFDRGEHGNSLPRIDWVIVGGESGQGARPFDVAWGRSIVAQCKAAGVPVFVKQLGAYVKGDLRGCLLDWRQTPDGEWHRLPVIVTPGSHERVERIRATTAAGRLYDRKGGDMAEWPTDLRVREFPF